MPKKTPKKRLEMPKKRLEIPKKQRMTGGWRFQELGEKGHGTQVESFALGEKGKRKRGGTSQISHK